MVTNLGLTAFIRGERQRDLAKSAAYDEDAARSKGVGWSALGPDPWRPRSAARIEDCARERMRRLREWRASRDGRFLAAVADGQRAAERAHLAAEAARAAISSRSKETVRRCRAAAESLETEGHALIAAARAARRCFSRDAAVGPQPP